MPSMVMQAGFAGTMPWGDHSSPMVFRQHWLTPQQYSRIAPSLLTQHDASEGTVIQQGYTHQGQFGDHAETPAESFLLAGLALFEGSSTQWRQQYLHDLACENSTQLFARGYQTPH